MKNPVYKALFFLLTFACSKNLHMNTLKEQQVTFDKYGHTLNASQVFSPDGKWVIYDTRNDDTHISRTGSIEKVNLESGEVRLLYKTPYQTVFGPGVGAVAFHPTEEKAIFIHGLLNCSEERPYGFTRRFGAIVDTGRPSGFVHAEARTLGPVLHAGALRGGTHAHTWSGDGKRISFTYNDYLMEQLEKENGSTVRDLRTIGVMSPDVRVAMEVENEESFSGNYFSVVTATVTEKPAPGSDDIDRAFDECWIGTGGYVKKDGSRQKYAVAFQGNVRDSLNNIVTEIFVSDIPEDIQSAVPGHPLEGTPTTRQNIPAGLVQRRLTFTAINEFPGVQGPRCRLRSSPDGSIIYFPRKDSKGIVQVFEVGVNGGEPRAVTQFTKSIESQFNVSPDGKFMSCISENRIWIVDLIHATAKAITEVSTEPIAGGALWSPDGNTLVYNRYVLSGAERFLQVFRIKVS